MIVEKEIQEKWKSLYTRGDIELIRLSMPKKQRVTAENIRVCLKEGEFSNMNVFQAVATFFKAKETKIKKLLKTNTPSVI